MEHEIRGSDLFSLVNKKILVTGAGRGLGRAMAEGLAGAGGTVALMSRSSDQVEQVASRIGQGAVPVAGDVASQDVGELVDRVESAVGGPIDVVLHAAGVQHRQPAENFSSLEWDRVLSINLTAPFRISQEIGRRQLDASMEGSHIFIGSLTSSQSVPDVVAYTASKAGIVGAMRNLSTEWSGSGVRANAIGPGYFRTELTEAVFSDPVRYQQMLDRIPMKRFGNPHELVGAAVFLASQASSYVTGQLLMVDGGWTSR
ncbi:SDR family oxidoreductase [Micrococcus terreus]|uniref:SDR family oxidoreductase n=1 Tax=Micrococcus terreus TaxID=574650 RepID=UPI00254FC954|nr:SDR family oxidoreductase [Micrococcus terreus]MDK7701093.1 SDR family oxidoreductase [Micrococcus terreus]WOO96851.1 SDR family oxidoreductase [Micrococcus terreus]